MVIIDTAPLMLVSDSSSLLPLADMVVYVCKSQYSDLNLLQFSRQTLLLFEIGHYYSCSPLFGIEKELEDELKILISKKPSKKQENNVIHSVLRIRLRTDMCTHARYNHMILFIIDFFCVYINYINSFFYLFPLLLSFFSISTNCGSKPILHSSRLESLGNKKQKC